MNMLGNLYAEYYHKSLYKSQNIFFLKNEVKNH